MKNTFLLKYDVVIIKFELYFFIILVEMHHYFLFNDLKGFGNNGTKSVLWYQHFGVYCHILGGTAGICIY